MCDRPDWQYDDLRQVGLDFADPAEVTTYDDRQSTKLDEDRALIMMLGVTPEHEVADIGCGTGLLVAAAAEVCRRVVAIDASPAMLAATAARAKSMRLGNIETQHASFLSFEAQPNSIDLITTKFALHHLPDLWKGVALTRINQALKPGGKLFIRDVVLNCGPSEISEVAESWIAWMTANTGYSRAETATHLREEHSTYGWIMERLLEEAGFTIVRAAYEPPVYADYIAVKS